MSSNCVAGRISQSKKSFLLFQAPKSGFQTPRPCTRSGKGQGHLDGGACVCVCVFKISPAFSKWRQSDGTLKKMPRCSASATLRSH